MKAQETEREREGGGEFIEGKDGEQKKMLSSCKFGSIIRVVNKITDQCKVQTK